MAHRNLGETNLCSEPGKCCFVVRVSVAVHEDDGDGAYTTVKGVL